MRADVPGAAHDADERRVRPAAPSRASRPGPARRGRCARRRPRRPAGHVRDRRLDPAPRVARPEPFRARLHDHRVEADGRRPAHQGRGDRGGGEHQQQRLAKARFDVHVDRPEIVLQRPGRRLARRERLPRGVERARVELRAAERSRDRPVGRQEHLLSDAARRVARGADGGREHDLLAGGAAGDQLVLDGPVGGRADAPRRPAACAASLPCVGRAVHGVPGEQLERVAEEGNDGLEALEGTLRAAGQVHDQGRPAAAGDRPGERRQGSGRRPAARISSARPGASRSMTARVASGVTSRGPKPVPPVVATSATPSRVGELRQQSLDAGRSSGTTSCRTTSKPSPVSSATSARPDSSSRTPSDTPSLTVTTAARTAGGFAHANGCYVASARRGDAAGRAASLGRERVAPVQRLDPVAVPRHRPSSPLDLC